MMTPDQIKSAMGIDDLTVRESDSTAFYWLTIARNGQSWSYRLDKDPKPHHIEAAKEAAAEWWEQEQE